MSFCERLALSGFLMFPKISSYLTFQLSSQQSRQGMRARLLALRDYCRCRSPGATFIRKMVPHRHQRWALESLENFGRPNPRASKSIPVVAIPKTLIRILRRPLTADNSLAPEWQQVGGKRTFAGSHDRGPLGLEADPCLTDQAGK